MDYNLKKDNKILELELRKKIFFLVNKYAGSHLRELERISGIPYSTIKYHLHYLARHGLVIEKSGGGNNKYYPRTIDVGDIDILGLLKQKNVRKILIYLVSENDCTNKDLEFFTGLAPSTVAWYMKKLLQKQIVEKTSGNNRVIYRLIFDKEKIVKTLITYRESLLDSLVEKTIAMWELD